jgi:hypothetical protein
LPPGRHAGTDLRRARDRELAVMGARGWAPTIDSSITSSLSQLGGPRRRRRRLALEGVEGQLRLVPLHKELKRGTLHGILRDAGLDADELRDEL